MSVSAGRFHKEAVTFTRCGQTCGTKRTPGRRSPGVVDHGYERTRRAGQPCGQRFGPGDAPGSAWSTSCSPTSRPGSGERAGHAPREHRDHRRPDDFTRTQLEGRLRGQLEDALTAIFGREIRLAVTVNPAARRRDAPASRSPSRQSPSVDYVDRSTCRSAARSRPRRPSPSRRARHRARDPAQPEVHLRDLRHRLVQPVPARRRGRGGRGAGQGLQPAARLRRLRAGQDPPAARDRPLRAQPLHRRQGALRVAARSSPTSSSTRSATTGRTGSSGATATSTCC